MKRITTILFLAFLCQFNTVYSQSKTPYQKKVDQIMTEMCEAIGVKNSLIQMAVKLNDWDIVKTSQDLAFKSKMLDRNELLVIVMATDQKLKNAKNLKNDADFRREREKKDNENLQKEAKLKIKLARFSDFSRIKTEIKGEFSKWIKKDEFETQSEYNNRISSKEQVIDRMVFKFINNRINYLGANDCRNSNSCPYSFELKNYDADKQMYFVDIICRAYSGTVYNGTSQRINDRINDTLYVNVELAKKLKKISHNSSYNTGTAADFVWFCEKGVTTSTKLNEWLVSPNGYFFPKSYTLFNEYTHINKHNLTQLNKMTIKTSELGLQDFFSTDYIIDINKIWTKRLEHERNAIIKQADLLFTENRLERAKNLYSKAYDLKQTNDIKTKITQIEIKIIENKRNELITSAENYEKSGSASSSISKLENAKKIYKEANELRFSKEIETKISRVKNKIIEIKQNELIKSAEQYENSGAISKSIEKLEKANDLKSNTDLLAEIKALKTRLNIAKSNHRALDSLYTLAESEKLNLFNDIISLSSLNEIKKSYGQKYIDCKALINTKINSLWTDVSNTNNDINRNRNREVWSDKSQELLLKINEFRNELSKNSNFELNVQKALTEKNKKYLKIFKKDNVVEIIDFINSKTN